MPEVIFCDNMKTHLLGEMEDHHWQDSWARISIFTAGNGLSNIGGGTNLAYFDGLTTGRIWHAGAGSVTISYSLPSDDGAIQVSTGNIAATGNGTAAEFLIYAAGNSSPAAEAGVIGGTITSPGGGGDMVIPNTSIVSGTSYRVLNWQISLIADFSY